MKAIIHEGTRNRENEVRHSVETHSRSFGLDPNLVRALITQESRFRSQATSPTGAFGFGQMTSIGSRQVAIIGAMKDCPDPTELVTFIKSSASDPDLGIKAVCATLWWLLNKKFARVKDKKIKLEAALTFYNSGGKAAYLVTKYGGHAQAVEAIKALPKKYRSQAVHYAPEVSLWYIAWHELENREIIKVPISPRESCGSLDPFIQRPSKKLSAKYLALIEALNLLSKEDDGVDIIIDVRENVTEVTLIVPGEFEPHGSN